MNVGVASVSGSWKQASLELSSPVFECGVPCYVLKHGLPFALQTGDELHVHAYSREGM